jgi:hypothetical protein
MSKRLLLILAIVLMAGGLYVRAQNQHQAQKLADALVAADKAAQDTKVPLQNLRDYVAAHMGARATVTLQASYDRAVAAAKAQANAQAANDQVYADAQRACTSKADSLVQAHCNQEYLANHLVALPPAGPVVAPKLADYQYSLRAPLWTPDLAGALLLGGAVALVWIGLKLLRPGRR